jgi:rubredoxin-NAD+ reductase
VKKRYAGRNFDKRHAMAKYICNICGYIYDEQLGCEEDGLAPGTKWEDIPDDWYCPDCGVTKSDFTLLEGDD